MNTACMMRRGHTNYTYNIVSFLQKVSYCPSPCYIGYTWCKTTLLTDLYVKTMKVNLRCIILYIIKIYFLSHTQIFKKRKLCECIFEPHIYIERECTSIYY